MTGGRKHHKQVPYGVRHWNETICFEEHDAQYIEGSAIFELNHAIEIVSG